MEFKYKHLGSRTSLFPTNYGQCPSLSRTLTPIPTPLPNLLQTAFATIENAVNNLLVEERTHGVSISIVYDQQIIWGKGFGYANASSKTPTSLDTIYRIGSISKMFTTVMMLMLRDQGVVHLDDSIRKYAPDCYFKNPFPSKKDITFKQLSTHLSGIPREVPCDNCNITNEVMFPKFHDLELIYPPDTIPGFAVLGNVLAKAINQPFDKWVQTNIIKPLGLSHTGVHIGDVVTSPYLAVPYYDDGTPCKDCLDDYGWANTCGGFYSSAKDLSTFISLFFRDQVSANISQGQILDGATIREMMLPVYLYSDYQSGFATAWELYKFGNHLLRTKRGDVEGYSSEILLINELKLGIVVLTNVAEKSPSFAQVIAGLLIPIFETVITYNQPLPPVPKNWKKYLGNYQGFIVSGTENQFLFSGNGFGNSILQFLEDNKFRIIPPPEDMQSCFNSYLASVEYQLIYFQENSNGDIISLTCPGLIWNQTFPKSSV